jgi:ABC-type enterochelin transport system permease subunit
MVATVRAGDPFTATNAERLQVIAWVLLTLQFLGLVVASIAKVISTPEHPIDLDAGSVVGGWLAVLLTFLLARVFAHGASMREDLDGTV